MRILVVLVVLLLAGTSYAQQSISGKVVSSTGEALVGATVLEVGTDNGTITDGTGSFQLDLVSSDRIVVSYLGYESITRQVTGGFIKIHLESNYSLEEVIIESVRATDDPIAYSNVSRKEIKEAYNGEQPIFILEEATPSIYTYSESGTRLANYGNLRLRGIDQQRINMTLNGIPLNDMVDHGVFFSNFTDIGNSIESMQVQRGVGTSTNGVASYAGSINFESINLRNNPAGGSVEVGLGSFNSRRFNASASTGMVNDKWAAYTSFSRLYSDGFRDNTFTDAYSFFLSVGYFGEKDFIKINAFDANSKNGLGYGPVLEADLLNDPTTNYLNENDEDDFGQQLIQLQHTHLFSDELSITSSIYYGSAGGDFLYTYPDGDGGFDQINYPLYNDHYGVMSNAFFTPNEALEFSAGVHAYTFKRVNEESTGPDFANPYYRDETVKDEISAFAKAKVSFGDLSLFGDIQVRSTNMTLAPDYGFIGVAQQGDIAKHWTFINPKIGVNYHWDLKWEAYASFGRTGREPTRVDILGGFQLNASNLDLARSDAFEPEFVNDLETGFRYTGQMLALNINYFYMDFENEIAPYGEVIAFGVQKRTNIKDSYRTGVELDGTYHLTEQLKLTSSITYMTSQIKQLEDETSGETLTDVSAILTPEWTYSASLAYKPVDGLGFTFSGRGISESYMDISNDEAYVLPAYFVTAFRVNYTYKVATLSLEANNLFDDAYYTNGSPVDVDFDGAIDGPGYYINAGRNYFATLKVKF